MAPIALIEAPTRGDRSYLAHDGQVALVVDPQRDIDRILALAQQAGVQITPVFEMHIHTDYVNAEDTASFARSPIRNGHTVEVSPTLRVRAIATPGHTYAHRSCALQSGTAQVGVFTGGSLLATHGFDRVVLVDDSFDGGVAASGLPLVAAAA